MLSPKMQVMLELASMLKLNAVIIEAENYGTVLEEQIDVDIQHLFFIKNNHEDFSTEIRDDIVPIHEDWYLAIKHN